MRTTKTDKPQGKTVHARDWRRLDNLSPTYANTHFKIMDNMLKPEVPLTCKQVTIPRVVYNTSEKKRMDQSKQELDDITDQMKKTILLNRLEIWGHIGDEAKKQKVLELKQRS